MSFETKHSHSAGPFRQQKTFHSVHEVRLKEPASVQRGETGSLVSPRGTIWRLTGEVYISGVT